MKILEQYIRSVAYSLPYSKRTDVTRELRSLMLDEIEQRFGKDPGEEDLKSYLEEYGSPARVAADYRDGNGVIAEAFRDIYFLILKIVFAALTIALTVVFFVELGSGPAPDTGIIGSIVNLPLEIFSAILSATGAITLVFIFLSRAVSEKAGELGADDWTVEDLKSISLEEEVGSLAGAIAGLVFGGISVLLLLLYPEVFELIERGFEGSGLRLGHYIQTDAFRPFGWVLAAFWLAEMGIQVLVLRQGSRSRKLIDLSAIVTGLEMLAFALLTFLPSLYGSAPVWDRALLSGEGGALISTPWWNGVGLIFFIGFMVTLGETVVWVFRKIRKMYPQSGKI